MALPSVSVIIPAHNEEKTLPAVLEALLKQDYDRRKLEIIVVDDRSTDGTPSVARRFPVKYIRNDESLGLAGSLNAGIRNSSGEIVITLHADCVPLSSGWIKKLIRHFSDKRVGTTSSHLIVQLDDLPTLHRYFCFIYVAGCHHSSKISTPCGPTGTVYFVGNKADAYRREVLESVGNFDSIFKVSNEDNDISEKIRRLGYTMVMDSEAKVLHTLSSHQRSLASHLKKAIQYATPQIVLLSRYGYVAGVDSIISFFLLLSAIPIFLLSRASFVGALIVGYALAFLFSSLFSRSIQPFRPALVGKHFVLKKLLTYSSFALAILAIVSTIIPAIDAILYLPAVFGLSMLVLRSMIRGHSYFRIFRSISGFLALSLLYFTWNLFYGLGFLKGAMMYLLKRKRF